MGLDFHLAEKKTAKDKSKCSEQLINGWFCSLTIYGMVYEHISEKACHVSLFGMFFPCFKIDKLEHKFRIHIF